MGRLEIAALSFFPGVRRGHVYVGRARVAGYTATLALSVSRVAGGDPDLRQCMLHYPKRIEGEWTELSEGYQKEGLGFRGDPFDRLPDYKSMPDYALTVTSMLNKEGKTAPFDLHLHVMLTMCGSDERHHPKAYMFKVLDWTVHENPRFIRTAP